MGERERKQMRRQESESGCERRRRIERLIERGELTKGKGGRVKKNERETQERILKREGS